ncbi:hypothetical protein ACQR2L_06325 [Clostridium butyricum]|uniref:hypothetical protein n=1 Tax=Clostridium butyricum TaxID=1492 RepID=UPI003D0D87B0
MYLSKPVEGFCIPVLYIRKEHLDISELKDIASKEAKKTIFSRGETLNDHECSKESNEDEKISERLIFDDDDINIEEVKETVVKRKVEEVDVENVGFLIFDEDIKDQGEDSDYILKDKSNKNK